MDSSQAMGPTLPSTRKSTTSASSMAMRAISVTTASKSETVSPKGMMPPVSSRMKGWPAQSVVSVMRSRVTPAVSCTTERLSPMMRLKRVDLPTLGRPTMATVRRAKAFSCVKMVGNERRSGRRETSPVRARNQRSRLLRPPRRCGAGPAAMSSRVMPSRVRPSR